jgi:hypothetical protein
MSYLHCHSCGWSQDDFWEPSPGYNPFRADFIKDLEKSLFENKIEFDKGFIERNPNVRHTIGKDGKIYIKGTEYVALVLERKAKQIRNMNVKTFDEWKKIKDTWKCPKCGAHNPDID